MLFESQIDYEFVNGDISTFLRYKYYARNYTYRIGVFDSIEFPDLTSDSNKEFERVRGGPAARRRAEGLQQPLLFPAAGRPADLRRHRPSRQPKNNIYTKVGYQFGTQFDERMNAIVGEQRGRITPVLTAFRDIGPQRTGLAAAITQSGEAWPRATTPTRNSKPKGCTASTSPRRRSSSPACTWARSSPATRSIRGRRCRATATTTARSSATFRSGSCYDVPQYELFRLGGREALKSISLGRRRHRHARSASHQRAVRADLPQPELQASARCTGTRSTASATSASGAVGFDTTRSTDSSDPSSTPASAPSRRSRFGDYDVFLSVLAAHPSRARTTSTAGRRVRLRDSDGAVRSSR